MPATKLIPFNEFRKGLRSARHEDLAKLSFFAVKTPDHFEEMREHLIGYYEPLEATHSFKDDSGQVWDCIPAELQPALKKSGRAMAKPVDIPGEKRGQDGKRLHQSMLNRDERDDEGNVRNCPRGSIPLRRITLEDISRFHSLEEFFQKSPTKRTLKPVADIIDEWGNFVHKYAHAYQDVANLGGHSFLNVWAPKLTGDEVFSLSQHWYAAGPDDTIQTVEAGWQIYPEKYNTNMPCLFVYWTADGYHNTGSYNNEKHEFVQTGNQWALGEALKASTAGSDQQEIEISWFLDQGNWWLYINGTAAENALGYYPASYYGAGPMSQGAASIDYGGEVVGDVSWPQMGSGAFPSAGYRQAAYHRNIAYYSADGNTYDANLDPQQDFPNCFKIAPGSNADWGSFFFYGGPGGNNC